MTDPIDLLVAGWWRASLECDMARKDLVAHKKLYTEALHNYCVIDKCDNVAVDSSWYYDDDIRMWRNDTAALTRGQKCVSEQKRFQRLVAAQQRFDATQNALFMWQNKKRHSFKAIERVGLPRRVNGLCQKLQNVVPEEIVYFLAAVVTIRGANSNPV